MWRKVGRAPGRRRCIGGGAPLLSSKRVVTRQVCCCYLVGAKLVSGTLRVAIEQAFRFCA